MSLAGDLSSLESARRRSGGVECGVARLLRALPDDDAAALAHLIDHTDVFATEIAEILQSHGHQVNGSQVGHHRRRARARGGGCSCPPPEAPQ